ncbi:MAG: right-handed parallel beta-helix repeat-containing protein [Planctomycetota bacterium]|jgi:hypothetical protein
MYSDRTVTVTFELPATIEVPGNYPTIQAAVDAAVDGDTIIINRGTYRGLGIYVDKAITLTSVAPDDPCTVAATVMDMAGYNGIAIYLGSNCGPGTVISGLTIANAHVWHHDSLDGFYPGDDGFPGGSLTGAGIYVRSGASPVIVNCIIEGARFQAGMAGNGIEGADDPNDPNADPPWHAGDNHGGNGGDGGSSSGGGIYCESYSSPTIRNCRISDCQIMGGDAGNGAAGVTPGSEDSLPSGNGGNGGVGGRGGGVFGGGIYVGYRSTPSIEYCVIENCSATAGNGGNGGNGGAAADPCRGGWGGAGGESGRAYGGGIYFDPESEATVTNCQIINCSATAANAGNGGDYGTAEHGWGGPGYGGGYLGEYWKNSTYGGGVYCGVGGVITFEDCTFQDNTVTGGMSGIGGIGYWGRTMPYYSYVIPSYGAGVFCDAGSVPTFIGCDVIGNQASEVYEAPDPNAPIDPNDPNYVDPNAPPLAYSLTPYISYGGGICYMGIDSVTIAECNFTDNFATVGGGVYSEETNSVITDSNFADNLAIYCANSPASMISASLFTGNQALGTTDGASDVVGGEGGGIFSSSTPLLVLDCQLARNYAAWSGGGAYLSGSAAGPARVTSCLITDNSARRDGAGLSCNWYIEAIISNCTIAYNTATSYGGGLYCSYGSTAEVIDSIIWGNAAFTDGTQVAVGSGDPNYPRPSSLDITYSDVQIFQEQPNDVDLVALIDPNAPDYFVYSEFDPNLDYGDTPMSGWVVGAFGWVGSDGNDRIIHYSYVADPNTGVVSGATAYIYTVTVPTGSDPNMHPDNPYAPGPVAPRTFASERYFGLGPEFTDMTHSCEFHVDPVEDAIYVGAHTDGILKYVFEPDANNPVSGGPAGNYVFDSIIAPAPPAWTKTLAYDQNNDIWYAGKGTLEFDGAVRRGQVWKYDGAQGPNGMWELGFEYVYPFGPTSHSGLEFLDGHLFLASFYGDIILQCAPEGTLVNAFTRELGERYAYGMGWGALRHFWLGSNESVITELGGGRLQEGISVIPVVPPVYVEPGCTLEGWQPSDPNFWTWDVNSWDSNTHNIDADPYFTYGYYLSQIAAGQDLDSPCVDLGSDLAANVGMDDRTTRVDGVNDVNEVDMGFHYLDGLPRYEVTISVVDGNGTVDPNGTFVIYADSEDNVVDLTAYPDPNYHVKAWTGTDDDSSTALTNIVTVLADANVTVEFEPIPEYTLTVTVVGIHGSVDVDPNQDYYFEDTVVTLTALPDPNYRVRVWTGTDDDSSTALINTITMTEDSIVTVEFEEIPVHELTVTVPSGHGAVDPNGGFYLEGTVVTLTAISDPGYRLQQWTGTDNDFSTSNTNTVTITGPRTVSATFEPPRTITVGPGGNWPTIQQGVNDARNGDTVLVYAGVYGIPYSSGIDFHGRSITLKSISPEATVIIDCQKYGRAFRFHSGEDANAVVQNITIRNGYMHGPVGTYGSFAGTVPTDPNDPNSGYDPNAGPGGDAFGDGWGGGIFCTNGSSPTFINCTITNCLVAGAVGGRGGYGWLSDDTEPDGGAGGVGYGIGHGGAIACIQNSNPTFIDCTIIRNRAVGGVAGLGGWGDIDYAEPENSGLDGLRGVGAGDGKGGGVYAQDSTPRFVNCTISDNVASDSDDIIRTSDIDFFNNHIMAVEYNTYIYSGYYYDEIGSTGYGGGACYEQDSTPDFNNCSFTDNRIHGKKWEYLEQVWDYNTWTYEIREPDWYDPSTWQRSSLGYIMLPYTYDLQSIHYGDGAGLFCDANNTAVLTDCTFAGNRIGNEQPLANTYGWWVVFDYYDYYFINGSGNGGGLYCGLNCNITIEDCTFSENENGILDSTYAGNYYDQYLLRGDGGAIYCGPGSELTMTASLITRSVSTYCGGGLFLGREASATIEDCVALGNDANDSGGSLYCDVNNVIDINSSLFGNSNAFSGSGGAICLRQTWANIKNSAISDSAARRGGGLYWNDCDPNIISCMITGNQATGEFEAGGGFYCVGSSAYIENCVLTENSAPEGFAGAGFMAGTGQGPTIKNCLITDNSVRHRGGALYVDYGCRPTITNSTFAHNSALKYGGAMYCTNNGHLTIIDSIIWGNSALLGDSQIGLLAGGATAAVSYSDIQGGYPGIGNIDDDPCFVGDYYLSQPPDQGLTSPCVDVGSNSASVLGFDLLTTATSWDLDGGQIDMGYHHAPNHFLLVTNVVGRFGFIVPRMGYYSAGGVVMLTALPERGYVVEQWTGTDDDSSTANINYVTMDSDKMVTVEFEFAHNRTMIVPGEGENGYPDLQSALDAADDGDAIIINKGVWPWGGFTITDKVIMITSTNPDDPAAVAQTIIDCSLYYGAGGAWWWGASGGFYFGPGSGSSILNGITIKDARGGYGGDDPDAYSGDWRRGGAIHTTPRTTPLIANCVILDAVVEGGPGWTSGDDGEDGFNGYIGGDGDSAFGGGIYVGPYSAPTITNCTIRGCQAIGGDGGNGTNGGGWLDKNGDGFFDPGEVGDGGRGGWPGMGYGGGIFCAAGSAPTIIGCTIEDCNAIGGNGGDGGNSGETDWYWAFGGYGGGWSTAGAWDYSEGYRYIGYRHYVPGKNFYVVGDLWQYWGYAGGPWYYSGHGGGVYCDAASRPTFIDCTISNNSADGGLNGVGGLDDDGWQERPVYRYDIPGYGGGVYCAAESQATFESCQIVNNTVVDHTSDEPIFVDPNAPDDGDDDDDAMPGDYRQLPYSAYGGGMSLRDTRETTILDCHIANNSAAGGFGGGIYSVGANYIIDDSDVTGNTAKKGGGVSAFDTTFEVIGCSIAGNRAVVGGEGGGMYLFLADANIVNTVITDNVADWSGGGAYVSGDPNSTLDVVSTVFNNCLITDNLSRRDGGGISSNWYAEPTISNCTIVDNRVIGVRAIGGGLYNSYGSYMQVLDSIIWDNLSSYDGAQVAVGSGDPAYAVPGTVTIDYTDVQGQIDPNDLPAALDLVFCIDTNSSMADNIDAVKASVMEATSLIAQEIPDFRIAIVDYQDFNKPNLDANILVPYGAPGNYPFNTVLPFSNSVSEVVAGIDSLMVSGGGDIPGSVYSGLMHCIDHTALLAALAPNEPNLYGADPNSAGPGAWRTGEVTRIILLLGAAPPHEPEPFTELTRGDITDAANAKQINIVSVPIGGIAETTAAFTDLAEDTDGFMIPAVDDTEVVDAIRATITLIARLAPHILVENGCTLVGWDADANSWDPNTYNISENPYFIFGYYLSQYAAGQPAESNCVDGGSALAADVGMHMFTTRADGVYDINEVDMGYHYETGFTWHHLQVTVLPDPCDGLFHGHVEPNSAVVYQGYGSNVIILTAYPDQNDGNCGYKVKAWNGTDDDSSTALTNIVTVVADINVTVEFEKKPEHVLTVTPPDHGTILIDPDLPAYCEGTMVTLTAVADSGYRLQQWTGTDNDSSAWNTNTVTIDGPRTVTATFSLPRTITVGPGGNYATIEQGVNAARMGDTVLVYEGVYAAPYTYYWDPNTYDYYIDANTSGIDFEGKSITLKSFNADAPAIIDCQKLGRAFYFHTGEDANALVQDIIIRNGFAHGGIGASGSYGGGTLIDPNDPNSGYDPNAGAGGYAYGNGYGGGIFCTNGSSPTFINCTITNCLVSGAVGGAGGPGDIGEEPGDGGPGGYGYGVGFGGAVACTVNSNPTFVDCTITGNRAVGGAGGMGGTGGESITDPESFGANGMRGLSGGDGIGGGIYADNSTPTFTRCTIGENIASDSEDIIRTLDVDFFNDYIFLLDYSDYYSYYYYYYYYSPYYLYWSDPNIVAIGGTGYGGGAYYGENATADYNNCAFADNSIRGKKISLSGYYDIFGYDEPNMADPNLFMDIFDIYYPWFYTYSVYYGNGAGLCSDADNTTILKDCAFTDNRIGSEDVQRNRRYSYGYSYYDYYNNLGSGNGGALYCGDNAQLTIDNCTFVGSNNGIKDYGDTYYYRDYYYYDQYLVPGDGGAVYCGQGSELNVDGTFMRDNESTYSGGAFYLEPECLVTINDSTIVGNDADGSGGALYCDVNGVADINSSLFAGNLAYLGSGGAIYLNKTDANIIGSAISENAARRGGGLYWSETNPNVIDCSIIGNIAAGKHESGGGFYCISSSARIENCVIAENAASLGFGGGGYVAGLNQEPLIKNCLVTDNSAGYHGGGLYVDLNCTPTITNCTFAQNAASHNGGGLYCTNNSHATVIDTIVWGNTADVNDPQIGLLEGSGLVFRCPGRLCRNRQYR